jgi:hypothetical protein
MKTITLNQVKVFNQNSTSKYWRVIECSPQTVELKTWSSDHPLYYFEGIVINSHDEKEIGTKRMVCCQSYSFWLKEMVENGLYTVNN